MKVPKQILNLIKNDHVIFSNKAETSLENGPFDYADFVNSIEEGYLKKKEKDETKQSKYKYTIIGPAPDGKILYSCGKVIERDEKLYFVITFHGAD